MNELEKHTIIFNKNHLEVLAVITKSIMVDKIARIDDLDRKQEGDLVEARNLIQKSLDFPDLKF